MLIFSCFPTIARLGFAKLARPNLAKPKRFCTPNFLQTPMFAGQKKKEVMHKPRLLPRENAFARVWQKCKWGGGKQTAENQGCLFEECSRLP